MSESLLKAFREEAERTTPVPAFELVEAAGRRRRRRRHTAVGAVVACALAVTGFLVVSDGARQSEVAPVDDPRSAATPYPGPEMVTLAEGTYDLTPYADVTMPVARVTVPNGWNASYGPDRFAGIGPAGADNAVALRNSTWYAGLLVTEVEFLSRSNCDANMLIGAGPTEVLSALMALPRLEATLGPDAATRFGHPAFHMVLRESRVNPQCPHDQMFHNAQGPIGNVGPDGTYDLWLVDVDGEPLLVVAAWTRNAPRHAVDELLTMQDSLELHPRERPWLE